MKKKMKVVTIFLIIILLLGTSYAFFKYVFMSSDNYINRHNIELEFLESSEIINLTSALPMSDKEGINQSETFDFQVRTKTLNNMGIGYTISLEKLEVQDGNTSLNDDEIKIYLTDFDGNSLVGPSLISELDNYQLYQKYHKHEDGFDEVISKYKIRVWIDEDVDISSWNANTSLEYSFKINVNAFNSDAYKVIFNSNNGEEVQRIQYFGYDKELKLDKNIFNYEGYEFDGWSTSESGITLYQDQEKVLNIAGEQQVINLYAKWYKEKSYKGYNVYDMLKDQAVSDLVPSKYVKNSNGIQFDEPSSDINGKGIYTISSTENSDYPIYYYRGAVDNNNIVFADFCWKMLRTTDTGGVKLLYNGVPTNGSCNNTGWDTQIASGIYFNPTSIGIAGAGYSYTDTTNLVMKSKKDSDVAEGTIFAYNVDYNEETGKYTLIGDKVTKTANFTTEKDDQLKEHHFTCFKTVDEECDSVNYIYMSRDNYIYYAILKDGMDEIDDILHIDFEGGSGNAKPSTLQTSINTWYESKMLNYDEYIEDTVYCNDRSLYNPWNLTSSIANDDNAKLNFGAKGRIAFTGEVTVDCKYKADSFTVSSAIGNGVLPHPVATISYDEAAFAGVPWWQPDSDNFLNNGKVWWTMSPGFVSTTGVYNGIISSQLDHVAVNWRGTKYTDPVVNYQGGGVRPVISLKQGIKINEGSGTGGNPFTVVS